MKKLFNLFAIFMIMSIAFVGYFLLPRTDEISLKSDAVNPVLFEASSTYPGGNVDCDQLDIDVVFSSGRINFENGEFKFANGEGWINGLTVNVIDNKFVSWEFEPMFEYSNDPFDGNWITLVGAVVVKGSNASHVYFYNGAAYYEALVGGWVDSDSGLHSPTNQGDNIADLSNLTFCFVRVPFFPDPDQFVSPTPTNLVETHVMNGMVKLHLAVKP